MLLSGWFLVLIFSFLEGMGSTEAVSFSFPQPGWNQQNIKFVCSCYFPFSYSSEKNSILLVIDSKGD